MIGWIKALLEPPCQRWLERVLWESAVFELKVGEVEEAPRSGYAVGDIVYHRGDAEKRIQRNLRGKVVLVWPATTITSMTKTKTHDYEAAFTTLECLVVVFDDYEHMTWSACPREYQKQKWGVI